MVDDIIVEDNHDENALLPSSVDKGFARSMDEVLRKIKNHELQHKVKYSVYQSKKNFGSTDWAKKPVMICWNQPQGESCTIPFDGIPYMSYGRTLLDCCHGPDRHKAQKLRVAAQRSMQKCESKAKLIKRRKNYVSIKFSCPARVKLVEVVKFPDYKINVNTQFRRERASKALRSDLENGKDIRWERRIYYKFPTEHKNHPYRKDAPGSHHKVNNMTEGRSSLTIVHDLLAAIKAKSLLVPETALKQSISGLEIIAKEMNDSLHEDNRLPTLLTTSTKSRQSQRRKSSPGSPQSLRREAKQHKLSGRVGEKAEVMEAQYGVRVEVDTTADARETQSVIEEQVIEPFPCEDAFISDSGQMS